MYDFNSAGGRAAKVSYNRPHAVAPYRVRLDGAGEFLRRWEYNMVRFLEREGYDVAYQTDADTDAHPEPVYDYYRKMIIATFAGDVNAAREKSRLFMVPGMGHCGGGPGCDRDR